MGAEPDEAVIEAMAKAIHDTDDMADSVWPDADDDTGYRGGTGYVRLCRWPDLYRRAARNAYEAGRRALEDRNG